MSDPLSVLPQRLHPDTFYTDDGKMVRYSDYQELERRLTAAQSEANRLATELAALRAERASKLTDKEPTP